MGVDLNGKGGIEEMGRGEGDETIIRIQHVRKEAISNRQKLINFEK